jgi:hypothetical protein
MKNVMKSLFVALALGISLSACAYGGVATTGDSVVVARNDGFLFGLLRKVYVCKVTPAGLSQCASADAP